MGDKKKDKQRIERPYGIDRKGRKMRRKVKEAKFWE